LALVGRNFLGNSWVKLGWQLTLLKPRILSNLKSLLETGEIVLMEK